MKGLYRHYKGNEYIVHGEARHSETEEVFVLYCSKKQPDAFWVRPKSMFFEDLEVDGETIPRFAFLGAADQ